MAAGFNSTDDYFKNILESASKVIRSEVIDKYQERLRKTMHEEIDRKVYEVISGLVPMFRHEVLKCSDGKLKIIITVDDVRDK
jgi:hypothetical protein